MKFSNNAKRLEHLEHELGDPTLTKDQLRELHLKAFSWTQTGLFGFKEFRAYVSMCEERQHENAQVDMRGGSQAVNVTVQEV